MMSADGCGRAPAAQRVPGYRRRPTCRPPYGDGRVKSDLKDASACNPAPAPVGGDSWIGSILRNFRLIEIVQDSHYRSNDARPNTLARMFLPPLNSASMCFGPIGLVRMAVCGALQVVVPDVAAAVGLVRSQIMRPRRERLGNNPAPG
jgi:hypothetical protein